MLIAMRMIVKMMANAISSPLFMADHRFVQFKCPMRQTQLRQQLDKLHKGNYSIQNRSILDQNRIIVCFNGSSLQKLFMNLTLRSVPTPSPVKRSQPPAIVLTEQQLKTKSLLGRSSENQCSECKFSIFSGCMGTNQQEKAQTGRLRILHLTPQKNYFKSKKLQICQKSTKKKYASLQSKHKQKLNLSIKNSKKQVQTPKKTTKQSFHNLSGKKKSSVQQKQQLIKMAVSSSSYLTPQKQKLLTSQVKQIRVFDSNMHQLQQSVKPSVSTSQVNIARHSIGSMGRTKIILGNTLKSKMTPLVYESQVISKDLPAFQRKREDYDFRIVHTTPECQQQATFKIIRSFVPEKTNQQKKLDKSFSLKNQQNITVKALPLLPYKQQNIVSKMSNQLQSSQVIIKHFEKYPVQSSIGKQSIIAGLDNYRAPSQSVLMQQVNKRLQKYKLSSQSLIVQQSKSNNRLKNFYSNDQEQSYIPSNQRLMNSNLNKTNELNITDQAPSFHAYLPQNDSILPSQDISINKVLQQKQQDQQRRDKFDKQYDYFKHKQRKAIGQYARTIKTFNQSDLLSQEQSQILQHYSFFNQGGLLTRLPNLRGSIKQGFASQEEKSFRRPYGSVQYTAAISQKVQSATSFKQKTPSMYSPFKKINKRQEFLSPQGQIYRRIYGSLQYSQSADERSAILFKQTEELIPIKQDSFDSSFKL